MAATSAAVAAQRYQLADAASLKPHPDNPNVGDIEGIGESIDENAFFGAVLVQRSTSHILAGHHKWEAARRKGLAKVPVIWIDCDDARARKILLADNGYARRGRDDPSSLVALLGEMAGDLAGTSFDQEDLAALLKQQRAPVDLGGREDEAPPRPRVARCELGQLWELGPHRLLVGDATQAADVERLLAGEPADMVWTDPPYGVDYIGKTGEALTLENDALQGSALRGLLEQAFTNAFANSKPGAAWFIAAPPGPLFAIFAGPLAELGIWRQTLVWQKDVFVMGRSDYHYRHEPLFYGWRPGGPHDPPPDRKQDTIWEFARPKRSTEHPTMKPVALIERAIVNHTEPGDVVLDPFAGSGSTLIAAHKAGRTARVLEIDPIYADVICRRWQIVTGERPVFAGKPHDFESEGNGQARPGTEADGAAPAARRPQGPDQPERAPAPRRRPRAAGGNRG